ncbi:polyprenol reductase-like [Contarinia nasturtii]|uniref:polyprenol reductase-like n=1 Tax=Contarinia nasturtii TaxID=265458 RepID=UPI0012D38A7B|nr:polyprenol reductase-like [Contarinia nasturtii]
MMFVFFLGWYQQLRANLMLANLRKNRSGDVITEKHLMPQGGFFDFVSSPHMFFEVLMYTALTVILIGNTSWIWVFLWVIGNQIETAWLTHKWYLETFKNYPKNRRAIIPQIL